MSGLSQNDYRLALQAVADICSERRAERFAGVVVSRLAALVPSDVVSFNLAGPAGLLAVDEPAGTCTPALREELIRLLGEHPMVSYAMRSGDSCAYRLSDFRSLRQFSNTALYSDFYAKIGLRHELSFTVKCAPDAWLAIGLNRKNGDYRDRDLSLLRLVAPHIIDAHRRLGKPDATRLRDCNMTATLTPREKDVLGATRSGKTNAEIGAALGISGRTVQKHLESIFRKLDVHRRTAAALAFVPYDGERRGGA
ncbi:MAG: LuxR C-terminal-related transcriptional regulator [Vulcanimicrobiaceae bacterium]